MTANRSDGDRRFRSCAVMLPSVQRLVERVLRGATGATVRRAALSMKIRWRRATSWAFGQARRTAPCQHPWRHAPLRGVSDAWELFWALAEEVDIPMAFILPL